MTPDADLLARLRDTGYVPSFDTFTDGWVLYRRIDGEDGYPDVADEPEGVWRDLTVALNDLGSAT